MRDGVALVFVRGTYFTLIIGYWRNHSDVRYQGFQLQLGVIDFTLHLRGPQRSMLNESMLSDIAYPCWVINIMICSKSKPEEQIRLTICLIVANVRGIKKQNDL